MLRYSSLGIVPVLLAGLLGLPVWMYSAQLALAEGPSAAAPAAIDPLDWPTWRGPEQNGVSRETGLVDKFDLEGGDLLWSSRDFGTRSTPIVMRGKLYTLCRSEPDTPREGEKVVCLDAATGKLIWENKFNVYLSDVPDTRVGWSCCVGDPTTGRVYAMGVCGFFQCLDGETGKTIWSHSLSEEFGLLSTYGGRTNVPVIFEDLVIISAVVTGWGDMAMPAHRFMAFDKATGQLVWFNGTRLRPDDTTYSTPTLTVLNGQAAMVFGSGDGAVYAFQPRTGKEIWKYQFSLRGLNISPIVQGDTIYTGQSEENAEDPTTMGGFVAINGASQGDITKSGALWKSKEVLVGKCSPVMVDGRIYALDDSNLFYVMDAATGKLLGKNKKTRLSGTIARASPLYADGRLYACTTSAWHVLVPTEDGGVKVLNRGRFPDGAEAHGSPIVSHGRLYLPTTDCLYCFAKADAKSQPTPRPELPKELPLGDGSQAAMVQVVPVESLIKPGEKVQLKVRLFNNLGQFLKESPAEFTCTAGGGIDGSGLFTAESAPAHQGSIITAKVGDLTGKARVRIVPPLPWKFDFNETVMSPNPMTKAIEGEPPVTWIGARYRHKIREKDGEKVMVKVTTIPKGTRSQSWMGPVDLHDYTVQADVRGAISNNKMPDIGLIAQRYTFDLMGASQQVQIRSWTPQLNRFSKSVPFKWQPHVWYTLKFQAEAKDGKAILKGKVWKRGEAEPSAWTVEAVDEAPNLTGSPGLFGNAGEAEIYLDNITVTPNVR